MTLGLLLQPAWLVGLLAWNFLVLSAAQLTIRLIMAFSVRLTLAAALALTILSLLVAAVYELALGSRTGLAARLELAPVSMVLMGLAGFAVARWVLRIRRTRGQIIAGAMVGLLDFHLFTLLSF